MSALTPEPTSPQLVPGLAGVPAAVSSISFIDGQAGVLEYRGYRIEDLALHSDFEETAWLLLHGELPTRAELEAFRARLGAARALPGELIELVRRLPAAGHPMAALQASLALLGMVSERPAAGDDAAALAACERLIAATPVLVAAFARGREGAAPLDPDPRLGTAADFLRLLTGHAPDELAARALDVSLVLHADHTMNASTFAARVVGSTEADPYAVASAAVGALTGPLHGGANERVLEMLEQIGAPDRAAPWIEARLAARGKVMGFGHRVYKVKDPRAASLQELSRRLFEKLGTSPLFDTALEVEREMARRVGAKGIAPNVDFFSGLVYSKLGVPTDLFTPLFAIGRMPGWTAHWREQMADNRLFRPTQVYAGERRREFVPLDARG